MSKHIYMGNQRIISKLCSAGSSSVDPRLLPKAAASRVDYSDKRALLLSSLRSRYDSLKVSCPEMDAPDPDFWVNTAVGNEPDQYFYHSDHLGSSSLITNLAGTMVQHLEYVPFGEVFLDERISSWATPYKFNAKELDEETGLYYYGARYYDPRTSLWLSVDPLAEKYFSTGSYVYCLSNPVYFIDPDGREVKPGGAEELTMIQNTLPKEARNYVSLDKNGFIDRTLLNSYGGESLNINNLKTMVESDRVVEVLLDDKFAYTGQDGQLETETMSYISFDPKYDSDADKDLTGETMGGLTTGESGFMGKTLFPDRCGIQNSPNGNIIVIVNKHLSPAGAAENYSHEANGHALLYILNGGKHKGASHQPVNG